MEDFEEQESRQYFAAWHTGGFEFLFDVTAEKQAYDQWKKESVVRILKGELNPPFKSKTPNLTMLRLRARFNTHRNYEMYGFNSTVNYEELKSVIDTNPQFLFDWIRKNGVKIYSDRSDSETIQIV